MLYLGIPQPHSGQNDPHVRSITRSTLIGSGYTAIIHHLNTPLLPQSPGGFFYLFSIVLNSLKDTDLHKAKLTCAYWHTWGYVQAIMPVIPQGFISTSSSLSRFDEKPVSENTAREAGL